MEAPKQSTDPVRITHQELQMMMRYGQASNTVGGFTSKAFIELPYAMVKRDIPELLKSDKVYEAIQLIMEHQHPDFDIEAVSGNEVVSFLIWIKENTERLQRAEQIHLSSDPEPEMLAAGVMRLDEFGIDPTLEKIARDWNYTPEQIAEFPYHKIYRKIKLDKINGEINKKYNKILEDKARRK